MCYTLLAHLNAQWLKCFFPNMACLGQKTQSLVHSRTVSYVLSYFVLCHDSHDGVVEYKSSEGCNTWADSLYDMI